MSTEITNKKVFITGGAGFIGSSLVGKLIDNNEIIVFDNLKRNSLKEKAYRDHPNLTVVEGDILDASQLQESIKGANYVIHCAAIAGIDTVIRSPVNTMQVNLTGTANLLEAATRLSDCDRVVCFSTSEVFGTHAFRACENDQTMMGKVGEARWTYAVSKLAAEHLAIAYYTEKGLPTAVLRPFNVYGPGQVGEGALRAFVQKALCNEPLEIHGDGTQIRAWCYIDDLIDGLMAVMTNNLAVGESFNIGNQQAVLTIYGLAGTIIRVLNSESEIMFTRKDYVDVELRVPSVEKAKELLNFEAQVDLEEGIRRTAEHYQKLLSPE